MILKHKKRKTTTMDLEPPTAKEGDNKPPTAKVNTSTASHAEKPPKKTGLKSVTLDVHKVQTYLDCALGEDPFPSMTERCQTAHCLANKLAVHSVYRDYNVYISFFLHRFIRFVEMQMHDQTVRAGYSIVQEYPNGTGQQWQFTRDQPMADRGPEPDLLYLYHVEIITPSHPDMGYGSALLIAQGSAALVIPFDKIVIQPCSVVPWHEMVPATDAKAEVMVVDNPMLALLWLHAALHMGGDVIPTLKQQSRTELNGMAMYELQLTDILVPNGPITDILSQYEQERVDHAATVSLSLTTPNPETMVSRKWW